MNFCPNCEFMLYTKLDKSINSLFNICKNCNWSGDYSDESKSKISVYKKVYTNEFLAEKALLNKYTIYDSTLPRISNIKCLNDKCLTNIDNIDINNTIHISNIDEHIDIKALINTHIQNTTSDELFTLLNINEHEILVTFNNSDNYNTFLQSELINKDLIIKKYVKPSREIIFIKFDKDNLKYLYLCSTCRTTWKTQ